MPLMVFMADDSNGVNTGPNASRKRKGSDNNKDAKRAKIIELESGVKVYQGINVVISVKKYRPPKAN